MFESCLLYTSYEGKTVIVDLEVDEEADFKKIHPNVKILEIITKSSNQLDVYKRQG